MAYIDSYNRYKAEGARQQGIAQAAASEINSLGKWLQEKMNQVFYSQSQVNEYDKKYIKYEKALKTFDSANSEIKKLNSMVSIYGDQYKEGVDVVSVIDPMEGIVSASPQGPKQPDYLFMVVLFGVFLFLMKGK